MMAELTLSTGEPILVDADLIEELSQFVWHRTGKGYATTTVWLGDDCMPRQKNIYIHRLIVGASETDEHVDHINRQKFDNRRENLRICTRAQNYVNQPTRNKLGIKGVMKVGDKYRAQMTVGGKHFNLGIFATAEEAAECFNSKSASVWGEFAYR